MSINQTLEVESTGLEDTLRIAASLGSNCKGGEIVQLVSDLGGGKTAFVRGLAKGMGITDTVHSPSFTISNEYSAGNLRLCHFDFYRLTDAGILRQELAEIIDDKRAVTAIEWATIVEDILPKFVVTVTITPTGEYIRRVQFAFSSDMDYLFKGLA